MELRSTSWTVRTGGRRGRRCQAAPSDWILLARLVRGAHRPDGRLTVWRDAPIETGIYQLVVDLDAYYGILGAVPFHPRAVVEFRIGDSDTDLHLPLMVTTNSYLTCRSVG